MEIKKMIGNVEFGSVDYHLSHLGIAVENAAGEMVSYDKVNNTIVNVDIIDIDVKGMVYVMPCAIKDIQVGDVIKHVNGNAVFVTSTEDGIHVIDVVDGEKKVILPTKSMFGFDFVTKIVTLIDFSSSNASPENPFGNLLPLMFFNGNNDTKDSSDMFTMMMLMNGLNGDSSTFGNFGMSNPLMMMALMGGSESKNFFPIIAAGMMKK